MESLDQVIPSVADRLYNDGMAEDRSSVFMRMRMRRGGGRQWRIEEGKERERGKEVLLRRL